MSFYSPRPKAISILGETIITVKAKEVFLANELSMVKTLGDEFDRIVIQRAEILIEAHERFRRVI